MVFQDGEGGKPADLANTLSVDFVRWLLEIRAVEQGPLAAGARVVSTDAEI